jgi:hypothetical protein
MLSAVEEVFLAIVPFGTRTAITATTLFAVCD